jgi:hypothetical protein
MSGVRELAQVETRHANNHRLTRVYWYLMLLVTMSFVGNSAAAGNLTESVPDQLRKIVAALDRAPQVFACSEVPIKGEKDPWYELLLQTPELRARAAESTVKALYYEGAPYQGKPTRVFAYLGFPKVSPGTQVPGIVLVHGGGGSAFEVWVRQWNARGYAAIVMDTCGCIPVGSYGNWTRSRHGGPVGWGGWTNWQNLWRTSGRFRRSLPLCEPIRSCVPSPR